MEDKFSLLYVIGPTRFVKVVPAVKIGGERVILS